MPDLVHERTTAISDFSDYIKLTTLAKKVGGPRALIAVAAVGGWVVARGAEAVGKKAFKTSKKKSKKRSVPCATKGLVFVVKSDGQDVGGLKLRAGGEYKVLECDGDAILIEVLNDSNNPYFASSHFLRSVSDFPIEDSSAD